MVTLDYLTPNLGRQVSLVLRNETVSGVLTDIDYTMDVVTLTTHIGGEPHTIHVKPSKIHAIIIQDVP
jgi:hypothetical protein